MRDLNLFIFSSPDEFFLLSEMEKPRKVKETSSPIVANN